jgi:prepilin-type N-terminal cleavage/methylation domain-containing protein
MVLKISQNNRNYTKRGFSLIELMVSLTIFSIVMTLSVGTLLVLIDANAKAQALSSSMTNLSFAIDSMTRNIRTGKDFRCVSGSSLGSSLVGSNADCSGSDGIAFTPGFEDTWRMAYRLNGTVIEQWIDKPLIADGWVPITSTGQPSAVNVSNLEFMVNGSATAGSNDVVQPRISLLVVGSVSNGLETPTEFKVQSNVTQRVLDY